MSTQNNKWKTVTVTNVPDGANYLVFKADSDPVKKINQLSSGQVEGGTISHCQYDTDFVIRVRKAGMKPLEFHSVVLNHREEVVLAMELDIVYRS